MTLPRLPEEPEPATAEDMTPAERIARFGRDDVIPEWWRACPNPEKSFHMGDFRWPPEIVVRKLSVPGAPPVPCSNCCAELLAVFQRNIR